MSKHLRVKDSVNGWFVVRTISYISYLILILHQMQFKEIIGQQEVKQRLINSVTENRVSHAQLFLGPEGSGSLALAVAYAQYLSCEDKQPDDSCGVCSSCRKYHKLMHPDLHFPIRFLPSTKMIMPLLLLSNGARLLRLILT